MDNLQTPSSDPLPRLSMRSFGIVPDIKESTLLIAATAAIATFPSLTWQLVHLSIYCRFLALFCHLCQPQFRKNLLFVVVQLHIKMVIPSDFTTTPFNLLHFFYTQILGILLPHLSPSIWGEHPSHCPSIKLKINMKYYSCFVPLYQFFFFFSAERIHFEMR